MFSKHPQKPWNMYFAHMQNYFRCRATHLCAMSFPVSTEAVSNFVPFKKKKYFVHATVQISRSSTFYMLWQFHCCKPKCLKTFRRRVPQPLLHGGHAEHSTPTDTWREPATETNLHLPAGQVAWTENVPDAVG